MSQLIMHSLRGGLVPILIRAEILQRQMGEERGAFSAASNWVEVHLRLTYEPAYCEMLLREMGAGRVLLLIDGLDEAGTHRSRIEAHIADVLAHKGNILLCTSRPSGLQDTLFSDFHRLRLHPLSDSQQEEFLRQRLGHTRADTLLPYLRDRVPIDTETGGRVTANPLMLSMVASIAELREGIEMPSTTAELYGVATGAMVKRASVTVSEGAMDLLQATLFEAHCKEERIVTEEHLSSASSRSSSGAADELRSLVLQDRLPLLRLLKAEPLQMQAFHLSFQEYYAMRAICGGASLPAFGWSAWWTNAVQMGVQVGDEFGSQFGVGLEGGEQGWRIRLVRSLVKKGLPSAWLPTVVEAANRAVAGEVGSEVGESLAEGDRVAVGRSVLVNTGVGLWKRAVVTRVGETVDVKVQGWEEKKDLPPTKALVVSSDGAGALLRVAAGMGNTPLVDSLLEQGVSHLVADTMANTPLHFAARGGHALVCRSLVAAGADPYVNNTQVADADDLARANKHNHVSRIFSPTLSDREMTEEAIRATDRLRAAAAGDVSALKKTADSGKITALMVACRLGKHDTVLFLLKNGKDVVNAKSASGCTALYLAAEEGKVSVVQSLLSHGADVSLSASDGSTPLIRASAHGHGQVRAAAKS